MIEITNSGYGSLERGHLKMASSVFNDYLPISALCHPYTVEETEDGKKFLLYPYHSYDSDYRYSSRNSAIKKIMESFNEELTPIKFYINSYSIYVSKGSILGPQGQTLMSLTMKKEAYFNGKAASYYRGDFSYKDFVLFYSNELYNNPTFKLLDRRFQKHVIPDCIGKGIEVRIMASEDINKNTLSDGVVNQFKSVSEMQELLENALQNIFVEKEEVSANVTEETEEVEPSVNQSSGRVIYNVELVDDTV